MLKWSEVEWLPTGPWWVPDEPSLQENKPGGGEEEGSHELLTKLSICSAQQLAGLCSFPCCPFLLRQSVSGFGPTDYPIGSASGSGPSS